MVVHIFNPDNDLALAADAVRYTPPAQAQALCRAGALLPAWYAAPGDMILSDGCDPEVAATVFKKTSTQHATQQLCRQASAARPWGWSRAVRTRLTDAGVPRDIMPDDAALAMMRRLSHRATAVALLGELGLDHATVATDETQIRKALDRFSGRAFIKSPWSCSGRGVTDVSAMSTDKATAIAMGSVRRQGAVVIERAFDRRMDCAALFSAEADGTVNFVGWSMFATSPSGSYLGNVVTSDNKLAQRIYSLVGEETARKAVARLETALASVLKGRYTGPLGVDMLLYDDEMKLLPAVEINLRLTMGWVARAVARHFPDCEGAVVYERDGALSPGSIVLSSAPGCGRFVLKDTISRS